MTTIRIKLRASSRTGKEGTLYYQVIHNRVTRRINSERKILPQEWDAVHMTVIYPPEADYLRRSYLATLNEFIHDDYRHLNGIVRHFEHTGMTYTADDVLDAFHMPDDSYRFAAYAHTLSRKLRDNGRKQTAENYMTAINSFMRFRNGRDVSLYDIDSDLIVAYEAYLTRIGICPNTVSFYMRNLRAIYNRAVDKGLATQCFPFKHVYTGVAQTAKRAVPIETIRKILHQRLSKHPSMDFARDLFLFSFYTRGMSFVDMAFLKKTDLQNGVLFYRRHKTNQQLRIKWELPMQAIINKYDTSDSPYLLPIIHGPDSLTREQYIKVMRRVNYNLKKVGKLIGLSMPLTTYVARHSWASIAKSKNISISTISQAMGHDSETTTRIYLSSMDTSAVDKANHLILKAL